MVAGEQESDEHGLFRQQPFPGNADYILDKASPCNSYIVLVSMAHTAEEGEDAAKKWTALRVVYTLYQQEAVFRFAA